jgi:hypothetical protein
MRAWLAGGPGEAAAARAARREDPGVEAAGRGTRKAHGKHEPHGRDTGGVEAQRLVERRRSLPRPKGSIENGATCGQGKREGVGKRRRREQRAGRTQV